VNESRDAGHEPTRESSTYKECKELCHHSDILQDHSMCYNYGDPIIGTRDGKQGDCVMTSRVGVGVGIEVGSRRVALFSCALP
jgi:hypothetical protein